jgi:hypothetical protein
MLRAVNTRWSADMHTCAHDIHAVQVNGVWPPLYIMANLLPLLKEICWQRRSNMYKVLNLALVMQCCAAVL